MALEDALNGTTRTGNGFLTRAANAMSYVPYYLGGIVAYPIGLVDTAFESLKWLFRGQVLSAATVAATGFVSNTVNALDGMTWWGVSAVSGVTTGSTIGTHARKLTEEAIGAVTGALGIKPQVLRSHPAGIGYLNPNYFPQAMGLPPLPQAGVPGRFATMEAQRRGQDPLAYHQNKLSGDDMREHVAALEAARKRGPQQQQVG